MAWRLISMVMQGEDGRGFLFMKISTDNMVRSPYAIPSCSILHLEKVDLLIIMFVRATRNEMTECSEMGYVDVRGVNGGCKIPCLARLLSRSHLWNSLMDFCCPLKMFILEAKEWPKWFLIQKSRSSFRGIQSFHQKIHKKNLRRFPILLVFESKMLTPWHFF